MGGVFIKLFKPTRFTYQERYLIIIFLSTGMDLCLDRIVLTVRDIVC